MEFENKPRPWPPLPYMRRAVKFLLEHAAGGLLLDPGMRKTSITLAAIKVLKKERVLERALIIAPLRPAYQVWPAEITKWQDFNHLKCVVLHGPKKEKLLAQAADIYIINTDGLGWLFAEGRFEQLGVDTLVVDESSKFRHTNTQRFKLLKAQLGRFQRRWILTGTPAPRGYEDLFGQCYVMDQGHALGRFITHYRTQYFHPTGFGGYDWKLNPGADKLIQKKLKPLTMRLEAEDYIEMPKTVDNVIRVELPEAARKIYNELEEEMFTVIDGKAVTAVSAAVATMKCSQVANGALYHMQETDSSVFRKMERLSGARPYAEVHAAKLEALQDLIEELQGAQLLVAYEFEHDLKRLQKMLKGAPYIGGGVTPKRSAEIERAWNSGDLQIVLGHPQAMGHGLNLQESSAHHVCWFSITWDFELYDQLIRRLRRSGNTAASVFVHHLVARETVDEVKMRSLKSKNKTQKGLLDALKKYRVAKEIKNV